MNAIDVENLGKVYASKTGETRALDGLSLAVPRGCIFGLLGPNGAGKTTLVKILTTITAPTSGRAVVEGFDVAKQSLDVRRRIAVVLQQTALETMLTVRDNMLIYAYLHGIGRDEAERRADAVLEEFGLADKAKETAQDLSIGTKRRVQLARIFLADAPLIFLDEATTGVDPIMRRRVLDRIRAEARKGRTVLLTTQALEEAEELCDKIMIIDRGRALAAGTLDDLRKQSANLFRVKLSFAVLDETVLARLKELQPLELKREDNAAELLFRGEEAALLDRLAALSRAVKIAQFEVRRADLEEIFINVVQKERP